MEGNACYKFSTIRNYVDKTHQKDIEIIVDIGANTGAISLLMKSYFPNAKIYGFEAVKEYFDMASANTKDVGNIKLFNRAVTSQHLFTDDIGEQPGETLVNLKILKGLPEAGPGWAGGSVVLPSDHELIAHKAKVPGYEKLEQDVQPITLEEIVKLLTKTEKVKEIDLVKIDCEGCEHSTLGCAEPKILKRIRFITGEYHDIKRFYHVMQKKLFLTHKVNLIGTASLGCFFAEPLDNRKDGILKFDKNGMLVPRPWLCDIPIDWHLFNEAFVLPEDRYWHALP